MKILLVDNDVRVIQQLLPVLKSEQSYEVRAAISGEKAIENAQAFAGIDLLITNVVMDPMNGFTLRNKLAKRYPGMKTLFISDYDLSDYAEHIEKCPVMTKPVESAELLRAIVAMDIRPSVIIEVEPAEAPVPAASTPVAPPPEATPPEAPAPLPAVPVPVAAAPRPVAAVPVPVAAVPRPVAAVPVPVAVAPRPVAAVPVPVATAPKPVASAPRPVAAAPKPVAAAQKPVAGGAVPVAGIRKGPVLSGHYKEGRVIGSYKIIQKIGDSSWGEIYQALQISMNRRVALEVLSPTKQLDPAVKQQFLANAIVKANVKHPVVLSVYEAGSVEECSFYAYEFVEAENLKQRFAAGLKIDDQTALNIVQEISEALAYFEQGQIPHADLGASSIYLAANKHARLANLATKVQSLQTPSPVRTKEDEMKALAEIVSAALPGNQASGAGLQNLLEAMKVGSEAGVDSWETVIQHCRSLQPKVAPTDAGHIRAHDDMARQVVEESRNQKRREKIWVIRTLLLFVSLTGCAGFGLWWAFFHSNEKVFDAMIRIPAGEFIFQDGKKVVLPEYWIDEHEVTVGQYGRFLQYLDAHPDEVTKFDSPKQPKGKSHKPLNWDIYYGRARAGKPVKFIPIDLNCPAFLVDWWDAYAYAAWKGHRLPTEQEWEKAARGTDGRLYPWGNEFDKKKCNSNADYSENPHAEGGVDGFNRWSPVDSFPSDKSPYGVIGMAGNVSEWTDSWDPKHIFPVIRGGNYHSPDNQVTKRVPDLDPEGTSEYLGFRTVTDKAQASR